ncbi:MAG: sigma-70 family RNA polymerase sigma factor [Lachnospiraceae bacterium]|nr:sigma-70 family RNA polymerase sigma factor [Lachnospiraceae bacterium]
METLTNEQLCVLAQMGDEQAKSRLIENNLQFIRQIANQLAESPLKKEQLASCGIDADDLVQAGSIGMWRAIRGYDLSNGSKFLTYAAPAVKRVMSDLIRQYSQDTVWRLKQNKVTTWKIVNLDEPLNDSGEDTVESIIASLHTKLPEQICIEKETAAELREAMDTLPDRENVYVQYRFGFTDGEAHPLTDTARYFRLTESRAKGLEHSALKLLRHELLIEIPERAFIKAEDRLTKLLVEEGELHSVELRLKSRKKRGRKVTAAVYKYLSDCDGKWGELSYNFKDDTAEILLLAEWDTVVSHRFAVRAIEHLRIHRNDKLADKIVLTFIGPEQRDHHYNEKLEAGNFAVLPDVK